MRDILSWIARASILFLFPSAALALDVPLPGKSIEVRPAKASKVSAKTGEPFALPEAGSGEDPTLGGAVLHFFDTGGDGGEVAYTLDASGWKGLGKPAGSKGWRYKGKADAADPDPKGACRSVVLKEKSLKATCKGATVTLTPPYRGAAAATLGFPGDGPSSRYCAVFGGDEKKNDTTRLKRKKADAPVVCPVASSAFAGYDPNDVATLASDAFAGRQNLTAGSEAAQAFLIAELSAFAAGLDGAQAGDDAYKQPFAEGTNILAVIPGGELADEYVLVGGHYDHLGSNCSSEDPGDDICNGATDNAAGSSVVLAIGRQLALSSEPPRRSVILALWDAEEDGLLGSFHYAANPLVPLADTVAYLNFDLLGANLLPSLRNDSFAIGSETGGPLLTSLLEGAIALDTLETHPVSLVFGQERSDYVAFTEAGVPAVFFGDSTGGCYHTAGDEVGVVDFGKLERQARIGYYMARGLIESDARPAFVPDLPVATFDDAVEIRDVFARGLTDVGLFAPDDQARLLDFQSALEELVADGEAEFGFDDLGPLLVGTASAVGLLPTLACDGFL
jgi:hypothetical protein